MNNIAYFLLELKQFLAKILLMSIPQPRLRHVSLELGQEGFPIADVDALSSAVYLPVDLVVEGDQLPVGLSLEHRLQILRDGAVDSITPIANVI